MGKAARRQAEKRKRIMIASGSIEISLLFLTKVPRIPAVSFMNPISDNRSDNFVSNLLGRIDYPMNCSNGYLIDIKFFL
jgi:hypothetical protein